MGLGFLVPLFLAGAAAIAIPLLVHLRHRERKTPIAFPSLMFLRRVPFREVSRRQIHHWPLFLLRSLVVVLLAFAFARPFLRNRAQVGTLAARTGREVVVLVDRSASMGYGTRWARAQAAAREVVSRLGSGDRGSLVLFDGDASVEVPPTGDRGALLAAIGAARPRLRPTRFSPALRAARELLLGSELPRREVVMISDFQRSGWRGEAVDPLPEGAVLRPIVLSSPSAPNRALAGADLAPEGGEGDPRVAVTAQVIGMEPAARRMVRLAFDGRPVGARPVDGRDGPASVTFPSVAGPSDLSRGTLRLESGDSLAADDELAFITPRERPVRVVLSRSPGADPSRAFLEQALAISHRPRVALAVRAGPPAAGDLRAADVVILEDTPYPAGAAGRRLAEFVTGGGGLIVALGERSGGAWPAAFPALGAGAIVEREGGGTIGLVRREHPVFEPFRAPHSGDFAATRVFRYRRVRADSLDVLARYDDGAPALIEGAAGRGRLLVLTGAADNLWSDLPLQPVFLPLVHQLVLHAARYVDRPAWYPVGATASVALDQLDGATAVVIVTPAGERIRREVPGGPLAFPIAEAGFHEVRAAGPGGRLLALAAGNLPAEEAVLDPLDPGDLVIASGARDTTVRPATAAAAAAGTAGSLTTPADRERAQGLWWYLLAGAGLVLAGELVLANRRAGPAREVA